MKYSQKLSKLMERKGYSRYQLAKEIPCSQTSVKNWLEGTEPTPIMKLRITEILGELPEETETPASTNASGEDFEFLNLYHQASPRIRSVVLGILRNAESIDVTQGDDAKG